MATSTRPVVNRCRHLPTVTFEQRSFAATATFDSPRAHLRTIFARKATCRFVLARLASRSSSPRSTAVTSNLALGRPVLAMPPNTSHPAHFLKLFQTQGTSSITKKTRYRLRPVSVSTSTVNRSQAAKPSQCACKNAFHGVRRARSGAGSIPWSCRIRLTVFRAMSWPRFASAPRMRVYPHGGFSTAIRTTRSATSRGVIGRPRRRRALPSYFRAISLRYQRRIVSGVTMLATCARIRRPSVWPRTASRRRWASVRRSGRGPSCSRRTRFSSRR